MAVMIEVAPPPGTPDSSPANPVAVLALCLPSRSTRGDHFMSRGFRSRIFADVKNKPQASHFYFIFVYGRVLIQVEVQQVSSF
eukprot:1194191-Prorocentrum_minimum.AAC.2